eukprot:8772530-Ditylum_brightwellii.AAC.1
MRKETGKKATTDAENAEVFANHFSKVFNNPDPLPCDKTTLPLVPQRQEFLFLAAVPSYNEVKAAIMRMANVRDQPKPGRPQL